MLADELRKNYDLHTRELSKEEVLEMYGDVLVYYINKLREIKTVRSRKFLNIYIHDNSVNFSCLNYFIPLLHFKSIVKYFESEGLKVDYTNNNITFSW